MILIYRAYNRINKKSYIGQTSQSLHSRINGHYDKRSKTIFSKALKKYSKDLWDWSLLDKCSTTEEANRKEKEYIKLSNSHYRTGDGYNQCFGGKTRRGWKKKKTTKEKMKGRDAWNKGLVGLKHSWNKGKKGWNVKEITRQNELREQVSKQMLGNSYAKGNTNNRKPVMCIDTGQVFPSAYHAREAVDGKFARSEISAVCRGLRNTAFGYKWKFVKI